MDVRRRVRVIHLLLLLALTGSTPGCGGDSPTTPTLDDDADLRLLFIGNSLTYTNDLPGLVETMAEAQGLSVATVVVASPNYSLQDHWRSGISNVIRSSRPDVVIMQQGPSSVPANQDHLLEWTRTLDEAVRNVGAHPAMMMVWPDLERVFAFDAVRDAYHAAAQAVEGDFIPVGEVFRALLAIPGHSPIGPDGFHPSGLGSIAAAATVLRFYHRDALVGMPASITADPASGNPSFSLTEGQAALVWSVVDRVVSEWGH